MPINKADIGQQILSSLLNYCILLQNNLDLYYSKVIKYNRYKIRLSYTSFDWVRNFCHPKGVNEYNIKLVSDEERRNYDVTHNWKELNNLAIMRELKFFNYRNMHLYFKGKLGFYKDFSMNYIFVIDDEGKYRLRSVHEHQFHNEIIPYWSSIYGIPLDHDKIHTMLYDAMNIAFGWKNEWEKIQKLFNVIEMAKVKEV